MKAAEMWPEGDNYILTEGLLSEKILNKLTVGQD
jgi:hypothetical protein